MTEPPIYVKCGRLIYSLSFDRYKVLLESLTTGTGFAFESDELMHMIKLDLDAKNIDEDAILASRELSDLYDVEKF
jgi:hypothetical protein